MPFAIDARSTPGVLRLELSGSLRPQEMEEFAAAHNAAVDAYAGADYRVFCDLRNLAPMAPEAAAIFEVAKAHSGAAPNFQGSAVVVARAVVAMQHQRTSVSGGVMETELITQDEAAAWAHLAVVRRR